MYLAISLAPYRIRRRDTTPEARFAITTAISDTKTAISLHQALLEMHAPTAVTDAYRRFAAAARQEARAPSSQDQNRPALSTTWAGPAAISGFRRGPPAQLRLPVPREQVRWEGPQESGLHANRDHPGLRASSECRRHRPGRTLRVTDGHGRQAEIANRAGPGSLIQRTRPGPCGSRAR